MDKAKFDALLPLIIAALIQKIIVQKKISQDFPANPQMAEKGY